jgi:hypothetical protein
VDAPRRWQVASSVTALAGLGLGALVLSRPTVEPVEPIRLVVGVREDASASGEPLPDIAFELPATEGLTIVPPVVVEDPPPTEASTATVASVTSTSSPEEDAPSTPSSTSSPAPSAPSSTRSTPAPPAPPAPAPAPGVPDSDDDPVSVDSDDSQDSDD